MQNEKIECLLIACISFLVIILSGCELSKNRAVVDESLAQSTTDIAQHNPDEPLSENPFPKGIANPEVWPKMISPIRPDPEMEQKIKDILKGMTIEQKVAQMVQPELRAFSEEDMRKYGFGSYLSGGGAFPDDNKHATMADWVDLADKHYKASVDDSLDGSKIPTMWGVDAVHGHNNVVGATIYPHNIGLGATNNPELIHQIGAATAKVVEVTGIDWVFAPTVAVVRNDRWGRTYEGYSEDPEIVRKYSSAMVTGIQGRLDDDFLGEGKVLATAKHFVGDGGTVDGDDQGNNLNEEEELRDIHAQGYFTALNSGVQVVMASFNDWHGTKMHGNKPLLTDVLKNRLGFDGVIVGDWDGHGQILGCQITSCPQTINAGIDIVMVPNGWKLFFESTVKQVRSGIISMERIDDAVTRILRIKMRAGIFNGPPSADKWAADATQIGSEEHRDLARQAVRESLVLLKNKNSILPLDPSLNVLIAGDGAHNIGKQCGGWTVTWQGNGNTNEDFPGGTSIYQGVKKIVDEAGGNVTLSVDGKYQQKPDVAIVVYGENPYAEGNGDLENLNFQREKKIDVKLLRKLRSEGIPVISVFITGRALWVNQELNASDAFVVAWLPGTEGDGVAEVLFKTKEGIIRYDFKGSLSYSWPRTDTQDEVNRGDDDYDPLFPYGFGLTYQDTDILADDLDEVPEVKFFIAASQPLTIYRERKTGRGIDLFLGDELNASVPVTHNFVTTQNSDLLSLTKEETIVPSDTFTLDWSGKGSAQSYFSFSTPRDLEPYLVSKSALIMNIRVNKPPQGKVEFQIECGEDCSGSVDVSKDLAELKLGEWNKISVDLACFSEEGVKFDNVTTPLKIYSKDSVNFSYLDVYYAPGLGPVADIACSTVLTKPLDLFINQPLDDTQILVGDKNSWGELATTSVTTTRDSENLVLRTVDRNIQEDSLLATWSGESFATVFLDYREEAKDRTAYKVSLSAMSFDVRVDEAPTSSFFARMDCGYPCSGSVDISENLRAIEKGKWTNVTIDFDCFVQKNVDFQKIKTPFMLATGGEAKIAFGNIQYIPMKGPTADVRCTIEQ